MADSFYESFDNGTGALTHNWAGNIDTSVPGQITLRGHSGVIEFPGGKDAGHGFGQYYATAKLEGDQFGYGAGPAVLLWPSDDRWPGTELDFVEVRPDGTAFGTAHRNDNGGDWYRAFNYGGLDESQIHTYGINWQADRVSFSVDGRDVETVWMDTRDAAHGGVNNVIGVMNLNDSTSVTLYDVSYTPSGGESSPSRPSTDEGEQATTEAVSREQEPSTAAASEQSGPTDWSGAEGETVASNEANDSWFM